MKKSKIVTLLILICFFFFNVSFVFAEEKKEEEEKELEFKTGVAAVSQRGKGGVSSNVNDVLADEPQQAVSASVSQVKRGLCVVNLTNNSPKNSFNVRYKVIGTNSSGKTVLRKMFSSRLRPGEKKGKKFSCRGELNLQVELRSGRKL